MTSVMPACLRRDVTVKGDADHAPARADGPVDEPICDAAPPDELFFSRPNAFMVVAKVRPRIRPHGAREASRALRTYDWLCRTEGGEGKHYDG